MGLRGYVSTEPRPERDEGLDEVPSSLGLSEPKATQASLRKPLTEDNGMNYEELKQLSKTELIEVILQQQSQIEKLRTILTRLKVRLAESEAQREHLAGIVEAGKLGEKEAQRLTEAEVMEEQRKRERATRDALRHLYDVAYLGQSPLAKLIAKAHGAWPDGRTLQQLLYGAIEAMRPVEGQPSHPRQLLRYDILYLTYLERKRAAEIAQTLAISERQYYRELKAAIQRAADHVLGPQP